jgi:methylmalonyl-CoA mutase N-terminal domain/subunit
MVREQLRGAVQNDVLKEYTARGNLDLPATPVNADHGGPLAYCAERIPRRNTISSVDEARGWLDRT